MNLQTHAWPVAAIRAAEQAAMAVLPDGVLMQRAAAGLAHRCAGLLGRVYGARVVLLVGSGDNGGDALYAGARLARRGAAVLALTPGDETDRVHAGGAAALRAAGGRFGPAGEVTRRPALVVDGLLGIGGKGALRPPSAALAARAEGWRRAGATVVAVDLPSGVDADTGAVGSAAVRADVTVTFGELKPGLLVGSGAVYAGRVEVVGIGLDFAGPPAAALATEADAVRAWRWPGPGDDKYTRGVVGVAAGSSQYPGAAVLSTGAALSGPAGYVRYAGAAADAVRAAHPEVVCSPSVGAAGRVQAWVVGSGLGTDDAATAAVEQVLGTDVPVLLDADGLTLAATHPEWLRSRRERGAVTVLTPHDREFARIAGEVGTDRIGAARRAADDLGAVVLLKGYRTIVAEPGGDTVRVVASGVPDLGTAGTGDVLGGLIGALLAAGLTAADAASAGAHVHGAAGARAAADAPVVASRLLAALPATVATLRS